MRAAHSNMRHGKWSRIAVAGRLSSLVPIVAVLIACLPISGCGPRSNLLGVTGEVLLDGAPLKSGSIRLSSVGSEKISSTGAMIREGKYEIPQPKGLVPGTYLVVISAGDDSAPHDAEGPGSAVARELVPAEYNINSEKTVDVTVDGENHFVFDIQTRK